MGTSNPFSYYNPLRSYTKPPKSLQPTYDRLSVYIFFGGGGVEGGIYRPLSAPSLELIDVKELLEVEIEGVEDMRGEENKEISGEGEEVDISFRYTRLKY